MTFCATTIGFAIVVAGTNKMQQARRGKREQVTGDRLREIFMGKGDEEVGGDEGVTHP
ncbi:hypothetical protein [Anabaena azotica]|uniref:hypothetical protein n=1 Tax=Anabaena azotica TaxID=197653 RepID=UPI001F5520DB|nr:hypothetical protein [Anabaena azotica]